MTGLIAFFKKEFRELVRTKKFMIIMLLFLLIGIMNPAIAKLTPKLIEAMADDLKSQGITLSDVKVTAMDSWLQFEKNMPMALIVFLIMFSGIFTNEYSKGTLVPFITKGLSRNAIVLSKLSIMLFTWSVAFWMSYYVTYFYSDFYWDNSVINHIGYAAFGWWLYGVMFICAIVFFSSFVSSGMQVIIGMGAVYFAMTLISMYAKARKYLPSYLVNSGDLYAGKNVPGDTVIAVIITVVISALFVALSFLMTRRRQL